MTTFFEICEADVPNGNKRIYPKSVLEKIAKENITVMGMVGMPDDIRYPYDLSKTSHLFTELQVVDDILVGKCTIFKTPFGKILEPIIDMGKFRLCGIGTIRENVVQDDYKLVSINFTTDPA
jgi:hypothetical protein